MKCEIVITAITWLSSITNQGDENNSSRRRSIALVRSNIYHALRISFQARLTIGTEEKMFWLFF